MKLTPINTFQLCLNHAYNSSFGEDLAWLLIFMVFILCSYSISFMFLLFAIENQEETDVVLEQLLDFYSFLLIAVLIVLGLTLLTYPLMF